MGEYKNIGIMAAMSACDMLSSNSLLIRRLSEHEEDNTSLVVALSDDTPNEDYVIYEKMDGSLGILFYYEYDLIEKEKYDKSNYEPTPKRKGEWVFATRGSFTSPQSIKGKELLKKYPLDKLNKDNTYLFEIIY